MNNIESIMSVVRGKLSIYDIGNVLDEDDMYRTIILSLRSFGNDATEMHEDVVRIRNGKGKLPKNYYRLYEARLCCPINYDKHGKNIEIHNVLDTQYLSLIHELKTTWDSCDHCCTQDEAKVYKKELIYKENHKVTCNYEKGKYIRMVRGFVKNDCAAECLALKRNDCVEEVSVMQDMMYANFNEGDVYIKYKGFLMDEKGGLELIDTPNGNMERFIEYELLSEMSEKLMVNKEAQSALGQLLPLWMQKRDKYRHNASTELKMKSLQPKQLAKEIQMENRRYFDRNSLRR